MAARREGHARLGARSWAGRAEEAQAEVEEGRGRKEEISFRPKKAEALNPLVGLSLAANLVFAQAAVAAPHQDAWFGVDKIKHFFISAFIESVTYSALQAAKVKHRPALGSAIGVTMAVGVGRELHDRRVPGNLFSIRDLTWDAIGTTAGAVMLVHTIR